MDYARDGVAWSRDAVVSTCSAGVGLVLSHAWVLFAVASGILAWIVTELLRSMVLRLFSSYVRSPAIQDLLWKMKWWKTYEAVLTTPMMVLATRKEHLDGVGRLSYKGFGALHVYWNAFLPEAVTLA
ncbi:hypothetical protein GN958_ATG21065 [Phytophthora infestans]|uniref:Uncharacterized protein n=1 Tax=Phytophthora infestans TaxID=4787 RepID=A0A8S9TL93_PHYIN|nr:hypothetical protein GN958_ATG21065 [Phytophthora infestans]